MSKRQITLTLPEFQLNTRLPAIWAFTRKWLLPNPGTLVIVILLTLAMPAVAGRQNAPAVSSTTTIPYQGRLANADGSPFTGAQVMTFRLFNAPSGGSPLWAESWTGGNSVQISDGLFSVLLGSLNNSLTSVVQSNPQLWLGIEVGTDAEMSPRVQLGSAAYAMQALTVPDASIVTAKLADNVITTTKLVDASVTGAKLAGGSVTAAKIGTGEVSSEKLKLQNGSSCLSDPANVNLTGGQGESVPGLTLDFTLARPSKVLVWMDGIASFSNASNSWAYVYLFIDGTLQTMSVTNNNWLFLAKGQRITSLAAGPHNLNMAVHTGQSGIFTIGGSQNGGTCISYLVLGEQ